MAGSPTTGEQIDRRNRTVLSLLGLILIALGVVGILLRAGVLALPDPSALWRQVADLVPGYEWVVYVALIVLGLFLVWLGWRFIRAQFATPTTAVRELTLQRDDRGRTTVPAGAVAKALERDVQRLPGVQEASARLVGAGARPHVVVDATVDGWSDLGRVRGAIEATYQRLQTSLGTSAVEADLHVRTVPVTQARVR